MRLPNRTAKNKPWNIYSAQGAFKETSAEQLKKILVKLSKKVYVYYSTCNAMSVEIYLTYKKYSEALRK